MNNWVIRLKIIIIVENKTLINKIIYIDTMDYHEPQLDMKLSIVFYVILWLTFLPVLYINILVYRMSKRESMILSWELKFDSICNMLSTIHHLFFMGIVMFAFPASVNLGEWYCHVSNVIVSLDLFRTMTMTFSIGLHRYIFIVHGENHSATVKKRIRRTLFATKLAFLVLLTTKFVIFDSKVKYWNTLCNGSELGLTAYHPEFGLTANHPNVTFFGWLTKEVFYSVHPGENAIVSIFGLIKNGALADSLKVFCVIVDLLIFVSILNVTEALLHYRIGVFLKR